MTKEKGRIVMEGMGGFLCPPTHPMHTQSVETDLRRRPDNRGRESLEYAVDDDSLDDATRAAARTVLNSWKRPPLDSPEVREWILQVLGYFRNSYNFSGDEEGWRADRLTIRSVDPLENAGHHAGVHLIWRYYPEYTPSANDFAQAYWGKKPESYPVKDQPSRAELARLGAGRKSQLQAVATGENRPPKAGEWYLSGAIVEAYRAPNDLTTPFPIARLCRKAT